jgi:hypothetical protein
VNVETLRAVERAHAISAWAATALSIAAAGLFASSSRRARPVGVLAATLVVVTGALGFALNDPYRARIRQKLFLASPSLGWLFERKLHAAFAAVLFAVCAIAAQGALARRVDGPTVRELTRSALLAWTACAALALAASVASAIVARSAHF